MWGNIRRRTIERSAFALALLLSATSCVFAPQPNTTPQQAAAPKPINDPKLLLAKMGLNLPAGPVTSAKPLDAAVDATPAVGAPAFALNAQTTDDASRALDCLTAAVYYEARSEPLDGQRAVAQVVLNRVRNRAFPASVCGVVFQGSTRRTGCQFSFTCDGSMYAPRQPAAWERSRLVAQAALAGDVYAPIGGATFYHANYVYPWWAPSLTRVTQIGAHIFYRWRTAVENALGYGQRYAGYEPVVGPGAAPSETVASAFGVQVHYGSDTAVAATVDATTMGVTIHRGNQPAPTAVAAAAAAVQPAGAVALPTPAVAVVRRSGTSTSGGVRVHRNVGAPMDDADAAPVADETT